MNQRMRYPQLFQTLKTVGEFSREAYSQFEDLFSEKSFKAGEYFAQPGDKPRDVIFVLDGLFRAYYLTEDGKESNKTFFPENRFVMALTAIVSGEENRISIQAMENATVISTTWKAAEQVFARHHSMERIARKVMQFAWVEKERRETQLIMDDATARYRSFVKEYGTLLNRIPQYHIASYLGITPVQLSRIRAQLSKADP